jgi:hypothetical protein
MKNQTFNKGAYVKEAKNKGLVTRKMQTRLAGALRCDCKGRTAVETGRTQAGMPSMRGTSVLRTECHEAGGEAL